MSESLRGSLIEMPRGNMIIWIDHAEDGTNSAFIDYNKNIFQHKTARDSIDTYENITINNKTHELINNTGMTLRINTFSRKTQLCVVHTVNNGETYNFDSEAAMYYGAFMQIMFLK